MQEVFEKIKERLRNIDPQEMMSEEQRNVLNYCIEIVNQVESEYQSTVGQVKCDASFSEGYIKGIDDAIEKFLEYGCFCVEWNPKLSKEKLVDDVMRQVRGQSVYILEKLKQKAEEYNQSLANNNQSLTNSGWIPCSERLPEVYEDTKSSDVVLVCGYDKKSNYSWQAMGFYVHTDAIRRWFFAECKDTDKPIDWIDIVAWQPLPKPYRGE